MAVEERRRPSPDTIESALEAAGFTPVRTVSVPERRRSYGSFEELASDLRERTGRSILHELADPELEDMIEFIGSRVADAERIDEIDHWTVWVATKPADCGHGAQAGD